MTTALEFRDTLIEIGEGVINLDDRVQTYAFLEFKNKGRIWNVQVFSSAVSRIASVLNLEDQLFIFVDATDIISKKPMNYLVIFGSEQNKLYKIDMFSPVRPEYGLKLKKLRKFPRQLKVVCVLGMICSLPLLFVGIGFMTLPVTIFIYNFARKMGNQVVKFIETFQSVTVRFPKAIDV